MKKSMGAAVLKGFYHNAVSKELKRRGFPEGTAEKISEEYREKYMK